MRFPPINLFSAPKQIAICKHTNWMMLYSLKQKWCYGKNCNEKRYIDNDMPVHTR
jgi:hypothetical protein